MDFFKRTFYIALLCLLTSFFSIGQISREFWFAAPEATEDHIDDIPIQMRFSSFEDSVDVTLEIPANGAFTPITFTIPPNSQHTEVLTAFVDDIETYPFDQIRNTGILVTASSNITCYYELDQQNNPDIFALKGDNALGNEFYVPFQNIWPNHNFSGVDAYAQFNIVATEDNTTIWVFPSADMLNHDANIPYSITLNRGETYSGRALNRFANERPSGTVISSDKPIAVTYGDDSVQPTTFGCYDFYGDQLVPTSVIGSEYILNSNSGNLNPPELAVIVATENFTVLNRNGVFEQVLFAGQTLIDTITEASVYYEADKPFYLIQITGFGCEIGSAILPPLNCAGSNQVSFSRSTTEEFFLSLLVQNGSEGDFELDGDPTLIQAGDFTAVPGTGGEWLAAFIQYDEADVASNQAHLVTNSSDIFSLGIVNGGATTGTRFGYFSLFQSTIEVDAGSTQSVCSNNDTVFLAGQVSGATSEGEWSTPNGTGSFDNSTDLNTFYVPSASDKAVGFIDIVLASAGDCAVEFDTIRVDFTAAPTVDAGVDQILCENNSDVTLSGAVTVAAGAQWLGADGDFVDGITSLTNTYEPTTAEVNAGSVTFYLESLGNGNCLAVRDSITIDFTSAPVVDAGAAIEICENNPDAQLAGSVLINGLPSTGVWTNGSATVSPSDNALNGVYTPTTTEVSNGQVLLILTSTSNGNCNAESDSVIVDITDAPTVEAGVAQTLCENNSVVTLNGSVTIATGGQWSGGLGVFNLSADSLSTQYTPTQTELTNGTLTLTLTSTDNGLCDAESDDILLTFTDEPTVDAGVDQSICENNSLVTLSGQVTTAGGADWSGGNGSFGSTVSNLNNTYSPTQAELDQGFVTLYISSTSNGNCIAAEDSILISFTGAPQVSAGGDQTVCENNEAVQLAGSITIEALPSTGVWSNGGGFVTPSSDALTGIYTPTSTEVSAGSLSLILTSTNNGNCNAVTDTVFITIRSAPVVSAGVDQILCANNANATLNGSITGATGGEWQGGLGSFNPDRTTLNAVYTPTQDELNLGFVDLTLVSTGNESCIAVEDEMRLSFTSGPTVEAGVPVSVCGNNSDVSLNALFTVSSGVQWSGGSGVYSPSNTAISTYTPSTSEISNGGLTLYAQTTGNGSCNEVIDSLVIDITDSPTVDAGSNITTCKNNSIIDLGATFSVAGGVQWSGGIGRFIPDINDPDARYIPDSLELVAGSVTLTVETINNGTCLSVDDDLLIVFSNSPTVNAGADQLICENNPDITLDGSVALATGGQWSGGLGAFSPNSDDLNAVYTPTVNEISTGSLTLTLTTTGNGGCVAETDEVVITFTDAPTVDAGLNQTVCENNSDVTLEGAFSIATGIVWTGGSGIYTINNIDPISGYQPSSAELSNGSVTLTLTTTGNGNCTAVNDSMVIAFSSSPVVDAGDDQITCVDDLDVQLGGLISGATSTGEWTSDGTGLFLPNRFDLNAVYLASALDSANGDVTLTLSSTNNGTCLAEVDQTQITITTGGTSNAGSDITVCANNASTVLNGSVTGGALSGVWSSSGSGAFLPDENSLAATYVPSSLDTATGSVTLTLTANSCDLAEDELLLTFSPAPFVSAGADQVVCVDALDISLDGSVSGASTTGTWTTSGTGVFSPNNQDLAGVYEASAIDSIIGSIDLILMATNIGSCNDVSDTVTIQISEAGVVDIGEDTTVCSSNADLVLEATITSGLNSGIWESRGSGVFSPNVTSLNPTYVPSNTDINQGTVWIVFTTNSCDATKDSLLLTIAPGPEADAGLDLAVCANNNTISLNGSVQNAGGGVWSTTAAGVFGTVQTDLINTFTPDLEIQDTIVFYLATSGNGACSENIDSIAVVVTPAPQVNAGDDLLICSNENSVALNGVISGGASTGEWVTLGSGGFTPNNFILGPTYILSQTDSTNGVIDLVLTSTNNGTCNAVSDTIRLTLDDASTVNLGSDTSLCGNNAELSLGGQIIGGTGDVLWSSTGDGSFSPSETDLNAVYTPNEDDITSGSVTLTLATTSCNDASDDILITYTQAPFVDAGDDIITCVNDLEVQLDGQVAGASTTGEWSTLGTGSFSPNEQILNAIYEASAQDSLLGNVALVLTATNIGTCNAVTDTVNLRVTTGGTASVGDDVTVCGNNAETALAATVGGGANGGVWTSSGTGTFSPSNTDVNAVYEPSAADVANGNVVVTFTSNGCDLAADDLEITITDAPIVDAGNDEIVCANNSEVSLTGGIIGATGGTWSSASGAFSPNAQDLNASFTPAEGDTLVTLYLTSTGNGNCLAVMDSLTVTVTEAPVVVAGLDLSLCGDTKTIPLTGLVSGGSSTGQWTTLGTGGYTPSNLLLTTNYLVSQADSAALFTQLVLTSTNNGDCNAVSDTISVTLEAPGSVDVGEDISLCNNNLSSDLSVVIGGSTTSIEWVTLGDGVFGDNTLETTSYEPGVQDSTNATVVIQVTGDACNNPQDELTITITPEPSVDAGSNISVCLDETEAQLNGLVAGASTSGIWTTSGSGTFFPNESDLNAVYRLSATDSAIGLVTLTLTATDIGNCEIVRDELTLRVTGEGSVDAGVDQVICESEDVQLNGSVGGNVNVGTWTTLGTGVFTPDNNSLNGSYVLSNQDIVNGAVQLVLNGNSCDNPTDTLFVTITDGPNANAGNNQSVCSNNPEVSITGIVLRAGGGVWTTSGTGTFTEQQDSLLNTYNPSDDDVLAEQVVLTLTTTDNSGCEADEDSIVISFTPAPAVDAGSDQEVCISADSTQLLGEVSGGASDGIWVSLGTGYFTPSSQDLNANYVFSADDTTNGEVTLLLTSTGNGSCVPETDTINITLGESVFVFAGDDQSVCREDLVVNLTGTVAGGTTEGLWTSNGGGLFTNTNEQLINQYAFSTLDSINGQVVLVLNSTNNGDCQAGSDSITITIQESPSVSLGQNIVICPNEVVVPLNATVTDAEEFRWNTDGTGSFSPDVSDINASYALSETDQNLDSVRVWAQVSSNGCESIEDEVYIVRNNSVEAGFGTANTCTNDVTRFIDQTTISQGVQIASWSWTIADTLTTDSQNPNVSFDQDGPVNVKLVVVSDNGCSDSISQDVVINTPGEADFEVVPSEVELGEEVLFSNLSALSISDVAYIVNEDTLFDFSPNYASTQIGENTVIQVVTDQNNCTDSTERTFTITINEVLPPVVPSAFTPNEDALNDVLFVRGGPIQELEFTVYNQWGNEIFKSTDPSVGWDGSYEGEDQPIGGYMYTVKATTIDGVNYQFSGEVNLIR